MGTSTSWIAIERASLEEVAADLGLTPAPSDSADEPAERSYQAATLPGGWVLLVRRIERDGVVADRALLETLSSKRRVVGCDEESHVMYSAASEWREGREVWAVIHSSKEAAEHLATRGEPPSGWQRTRDAWMAKHADAAKGGEDVDYVYEVPLEIAKLVVGYRLESDDDADLEYVTLIPGSSPKPSKPWWRFW